MMNAANMMFDGSKIETADQIRQAWQNTTRDVVDLFSACPEEQFQAPRGDRWSYAQNLDHLTRSTLAVTRGLSIPRFILRMVTGRSAGFSRPLMDIQALYKQALDQGGQARGRFVPDGSVSKSAALARWDRCSRRFLKKLSKWSDRQLDDYQMPHPLIGSLTVREMVFFTIFHTHHHLQQLQAERD